MLIQVLCITSKPYVNSNWSYSPEMLNWVLTSVTLTFGLWSWTFAWTSLLSLVITPENFMMIWWQEHSENGVTDGRTDRRTDRRTDWSVLRAAWSQLKTTKVTCKLKPLCGRMLDRHKPLMLTGLVCIKAQVKSCKYSKSILCRNNWFIQYVNSLWPGDVIWRQGTRSTLAQVMACCLTAPSHYLNQCWLIICEVPWHSCGCIIIRRYEETYQ